MTDSNILEISAEHLKKSLSYDQLLTDSLDANVILEFLSGWMSFFENTPVISEDGLSRHEWKSLFHFLKSCLTVEKNRHVIYSARKVLISLLKTYNCDEGMKIVQHILDNDGQLELTFTGLQICKDLFSMRNTYHDSMVSKLGNLIAKSWKSLTAKIHTDIIYDQCLLELFSVCIKLAKIVWTNVGSDQPALILKTILSNGEETINRILFDKNIKVYVKTKLIHFLCAILKILGLSKVQALSDDILSIAICLFNQLSSRDLSVIFRRKGKATFIGNISVLNDGLSCDINYIREWTFLSLRLSSCLQHQEGYKDKITAFLLLVDESVKESLCKQKLTVFPWLPDNSTLFLWLPDIYGDQDDKWIDAMIMLMEIFPFEKECSSLDTEHLLNQHHLHFLQFVRTIGYDHLVFIDLLTSPETNCLVYLTKYLKHLHVTWNTFISFTRMGYKQNDLSVDCEYIKQSNGGVSKIGLSELDFLQCKLAENGEKTRERVTDDMTEVLNVKGLETNGILSDHQEKCSEMMKIAGNDNKNSQLLASSSLLLIADAYNSTDAEDNDCVGSDNDYDDYKDSNDDNCGHFNNNENAADKIMTALTKEDDTCMHEKGINVAIEKDKFDKIQKKMTETFLDKFQPVFDTKRNSPTDDTFIPRERNENKFRKDIELDFSKTDAVTDNVSMATDMSGEQNVLEFEIDKDCGDDEDSNGVIDKVMGMLIRTRLQLEKLNDSCLMKFNPLALVNLIESIEELYEKK